LAGVTGGVRRRTRYKARQQISGADKETRSLIRAPRAEAKERANTGRYETMFYEANAAVDAYRFREKQVELDAERAWRFRHLKSKESVFLAGVLTSILGLFFR
jgi:tryptophan 2,3-dioxygenase